MSSVADVLDLLAKDAGDDTITQACTTTSEWAKAGRIDDLAKLADAATAYPAIVEHVEQQLALTAGEAAIGAVSARAAGDRVRTLASCLAYAQSKEAFLATIALGSGRELLACWLHELVLRGTPLTGEAAAETLAAELAKERHPLAGLPLALRPLEREAPSYMPLYGDKGLSNAIDALAAGPISARSMPPPAEGKDVRATVLATPADLDVAVRPWKVSGNGKVEALAFELGMKLDPRLLGSWLLRSLPLASASNVAREGLECTRVPAETVFGSLFAAAANGGAAPGAALGGAHGRRAAWTSIGALAGAASDGDITAIEQAVARTTFLTFRASGPWFHDIAWDLGVLALREDGRTVVVLAATDAE